MGSSESKEKTLKDLECPVCLIYLKPPIYLCSSGHSFCEKCKTKIIDCSICKSEMSSIRNYTLEHLIENIHYPCENDGCKETYLLKDMHEHVHNCEHTLFKCPLIEKCKWDGKLDKLINHLKEAHKQELSKKEHSIKLDSLPFTYEDKIYLCDGNVLFVINVFIYESVPYEINTNCQLFGSRKQINNYVLNVKAIGKDTRECIEINKFCVPYESKKEFFMPLRQFDMIEANEICYKMIKL